jgi:hypothetical protein
MKFTTEQLEAEPELDEATLPEASMRGGAVLRALLSAAMPEHLRLAEWRGEGHVRVWSRHSCDSLPAFPAGMLEVWEHVESADSGLLWIRVTRTPPNQQMRDAARGLSPSVSGCC